MKINHPTQDYTRWNLPEGAKARLGKGWINDIAYSADGRLLAVGSSIGIWLYDADTGEELNIILGHTQSVKSVSFSPDSRTLVSSSGDKTVRLWDIETGKPLKTLTGHTSSVKYVSFSPNNHILASVGMYKDEIRLWDVETGKHLKTLIGHKGWLDNNVALSPNGRLIASGGGLDGTVQVWNVKTGKNIKTLVGHRYKVTCVAFNDDSRFIASGGRDGTVRVWNVETGKNIKTFTGYSPDNVTFSPNGRLIAMNYYHHRARVWDVETEKNIKTFIEHTGGFTSVSFSGNSRFIVSSGDDRIMQVWDIETGKNIKTFTKTNLSSHGSYGVIISPNNRLIAMALTDVDEWATEVYVELRNVQTGKHIKTLTVQHGFSICACFSADSRFLAGDIDGNKVQVWDIETGKHIKTLAGHTKMIQSVTFSGNNLFIASGSHDGTVRIWDVQTGKHIKTLIGHISGVHSTCFSGNNLFIASGSYDGTVRIWDVQTGENIKTLTGHNPSSRTLCNVNVAFSPNGRLMVSGNGDGTVLVWDIETGKHLKTFTGHNGVVVSISFSPDGRTVASCSSDGTVLLWDVDRGIKKTKNNPFFDVDSDNNETTLEEKDSEFQNRESQIQKICEDRSITTLVHFTQIKNLRNILHEGLLGHQSLLKKHGQQFAPNDWERVDGHKEAICLSISFPNYLLFNKFSRPNTGSPPDYSQWIVLLLDAKVLWELDCAFCQENAASNTVRYIPLEDRKKPDALEGMFVDVCRDTKGNVYERQSSQISDDYPTHPQAEILVFDQIPSDYIKEVHFYDETILKQWCDNNPWINPERLLHNQQYFQYRRGQVVWQDDILDDDDVPFDDDNIPF